MHTIVSEHIQLLSDLVSINSINPDLVPGSPGEAEIAHYVAGWLERAGLEVSIDEAAPGRPSVVEVAKGSGGGGRKPASTAIRRDGCGAHVGRGHSDRGVWSWRSRRARRRRVFEPG